MRRSRWLAVTVAAATDGGADFTVANSSIASATNGAPGGYPSLYKGCHWGACTTGSGLPVPVSSLTTGAVTTSWAFPGDQKITDLWNGTVSQSGAQVSVTSQSYNGSVAPGGSVTAGFTGTYAGSDASPAAFTLNGTACRT
ncbi:MAG TPA: cellulose binding domain-containing protein [Streptosporangiaceae bacterium]|jgi:hypothetical protein|nr:cellulose binding domain-containing protein [Streptosporangiaceae bacterium]